MRWLALLGLIAMLNCAGCGNVDESDTDGPDGSTDTDSDTDTDTCPGEEVWNGDYLIDSVDDIAAISSYREINGALNIAFPDDGDTPPDLAGLECLRSVGGDVEIVSTYLTSLSGLENLADVGGTVRVADCASLADLGGLSGLTAVNALVISSCGSLQDLSGLQNLVTVGYFVVEGNGAMTSLAGLDSLDEPHCVVQVVDNDALTELHGLEGCGSSACMVVVGNNDGIVDLSGLEWATEISCDLYVEGNANLESFGGLDGLTFVGHVLNITNNPALASLGALDGLAMGGADPGGCECDSAEDYLHITENSSLPTCDAEAFVAGVVDAGFTGSTHVDGNMADECSDWCPGYTGADPCCLTENPCDLASNDLCDCDDTCPWDEPDCDPTG